MSLDIALEFWKFKILTKVHVSCTQGTNLNRYSELVESNDTLILTHQTPLTKPD